MRAVSNPRTTNADVAAANNTTATVGPQCQPLGFSCYRDVFGGWRWEFRDANGDFVDSQQSYDSQEECLAAAGAASAKGFNYPLVTCPRRART